MASLIFLFSIYFVLINVNTIKLTDKQPEIVCEESFKCVIIDTDMGADDAWALQMILKAEKELKIVKVLAITATYGNTDVINVIKNTYRILDGVNRTDIPIYKGASEGLIPIDQKEEHYFGYNGFGDVNVWKPHYPSVESVIQKKNAIEIIRNLVMKYPKKITIFAIAPTTNIALAFKVYPEIVKNIKEIFMMGGSLTGKGNIVPNAEFNFYRDPEAAFILLNAPKPLNITLFPVEGADHTNITVDWRFNVVGKIKQENVQLLNKVDIIPSRNKQFYTPIDAFTAASFLFPDNVIQKMNKYNASVELEGHRTRGQTVIDHSSKVYNIMAIEQIDASEFKKIMLWTADF